MNPTVIYCNPNAGYYELESEWNEFYLNKGINLFVWNYRGYGRSGGKPNPSNLRSDGETIVRFLRNEYKVKRLGVHGQSIGGLVACHLAKHADVDFVCADRTFSSLINVAHHGFGWFVAKLFFILTGWSNDSSENFINASCYKVLTFDPNDEIIKYPSSLKYALTKRVAEKLQIFDHESNERFSKKSISSPKGLMLFKRIHHNQYYKLLTEYEMNALYCALRRILGLSLDILKRDLSATEPENGVPIPKDNGVNNLNLHRFEKLAVIIGSLEAGGISLTESIKSIDTFKEFLLSLEVWGSIITRSFVSNLPKGSLQQRSIGKIKEFIEKWKSVMNSYTSIQSEYQTAVKPKALN